MKLSWFLSDFGLALSDDEPAYSPNELQATQPINIENNKNAYQRSQFWEISQNLDRSSDTSKGPNHIFPKSCVDIVECAQNSTICQHRNKICKNTFGSYSCVCPDGFIGDKHCTQITTATSQSTSIIMAGKFIRYKQIVMHCIKSTA